MRAPAPPTRKAFNCIVDDTALMAGVKKSTRDGIRKWISQGAIRLFVPLHTLAQLQRLKNGSERVNADAREAVKWLDEVTSLPAVEATNGVQLEGAEEAYTTWDEVEKHQLPETLLSMDDSESDDDGAHDDLESSFAALEVSDDTSVSSTHSLEDTPKTPESPRSFVRSDSKTAHDVTHKENAAALLVQSPDRTARNSSELARGCQTPKAAVPAYLQPLFNHILWRIHKESNPDAALESFILLTNDPAKQIIAQKFGIRAKRLEQLRDAVAREDREFRNHLTMYKLEAEATAAKASGSPAAPKQAESPKSPKSTHSAEAKPQANSDDEDVVLLQRAPRGPAKATNDHRVLDPNDFARANQHHSPRGGRGAQLTPRGSPIRGRGAFTPRGAYVPPTPPVRAPPAPRFDPNQPIDPNSFARPNPRASPVRGGGRRKLWEPN
ncbi:hypothetical protein P153DRAFT_285427 [Dothidotthia symphoricarpi CBS 119687]|uniref:PIN domain-containing protein n=1 Tax=Dothidotthia symphoricarpi CBS 119687 TaxID=1392245 RepID=A0A6A6ALY1_9PLEO|nr:uncharacterized protein P153DRAFT_285427 [Dothidotthia symphoricarpi CBS 119687]KAF2131944.1 hypothetical protein P153DRAFT_285427 [Dothidotthia symphoricarpi CBS 119687]